MADIIRSCVRRTPCSVGQRLRLRPSAAAAALACLCAFGCSAAAPADALARVRARGVLRWGADIQGGEPFVFEDPARPGTFTGFEAENANALGRELSVRAEMVQNDWSTLVPSLERGTFDVIMNGL